MNFWLWALAFFTGFVLGLFTAGLMCAAARSRDEEERIFMAEAMRREGGN